MVFRKTDGNAFFEQGFPSLVRLDSSHLDSQPLEAMACSSSLHDSLCGLNYLVAVQAVALGRTASIGTPCDGRNSGSPNAHLGQD